MDRHRRITWILCAAAGAVAVGAPGVASASEGGLVLWPDFTRTLPFLLLLFVLLIYPVNVLIFRPIFRVLELRERKIAGNRESARRVEKEADAILERYEDSLRAAREQAEADRKTAREASRRDQASRTDTARGEAEGELGRARDEIGQALAQARSGLRKQAEALAAEAAARIIGRPLS